MQKNKYVRTLERKYESHVFGGGARGGGGFFTAPRKRLGFSAKNTLRKEVNGFNFRTSIVRGLSACFLRVFVHSRPPINHGPGSINHQRMGGGGGGCPASVIISRLNLSCNILSSRTPLPFLFHAVRPGVSETACFHTIVWPSLLEYLVISTHLSR